MGEKLVVGPIDKGLTTDRTAFNIDNDSFPVLSNAYQWRGRIKRKRGTYLLGRLQRFLGTTDVTGGLVVTIAPTPITSGIATFTVGTDLFVDQGGASPVALTTNSSGTATLNRATGVLTIVGSQPSTSVIYYPRLPVMGIEEMVLSADLFPLTLAFDDTYSYLIQSVDPYNIYDVSYYKNPAASAPYNYAGYVRKGTWSSTYWNGENYQQFWTTNYEGAIWATNGINVPFSITNIGMQFKAITGIVINAVGPPALATLTIVAHGLVQGDFVFINEVGGITGINFQTGYVVSADPQAANTIQVEFPNATLGGVYSANTGIAQYLTSNAAAPTKDCIRWFDGDPTDGNPPDITFGSSNGWVNFMPPLMSNTNTNFSIADLPFAQYYLVGARMIVPYKDRLLFIGPVVQSSTGSPIYLQDTVIYSQNGTPYYTASFTGSIFSSATVFNPILTPRVPASTSTVETATPSAFFEDVTGFGGFFTAGLSQPIITVGNNEDVLILGFSNRQMRLVYTGNDIIPFNGFIVNSEYGSNSTFSAITLDRGVISRGDRGIIIANQVGAQRIDLDIPDQVFEFNLTTNGSERVTASRDFINEWIYLTYVDNEFNTTFPNQTLQYNYRDNSWALFTESYTTYGPFRFQTGFTWATVGRIYPTWAQWNQPWDAGESTLLQPVVLAGNQQGFILVRDTGTAEGESVYIQSISGNTVTSPDHGLLSGDFIIISGAIGTTVGGINNMVFKVGNVTLNSFQLNPPPSQPVSGYIGNGLIKRMYVPLIQTKQFPVAWGMSRKTRIGPQQYLLSTTQSSQITLLIFLSQNSNSAYNTGPIVPEEGSYNDSLIYSTVLYTCPESSNLGLTSPNTNLQLITADQQSQIWHRMNTSLVGDTVQLGFTMSESQMRHLTVIGRVADITGATQANPCVLTANNAFEVGQLVQIEDVIGMGQLNGNIYNITAVSATTVTIDVNSTAFTAYVSGGTATPLGPIDQFAEIELHSMILDVQPSSMLA